jgi:hypothetical protein
MASLGRVHRFVLCVVGGLAFAIAATTAASAVDYLDTTNTGGVLSGGTQPSFFLPAGQQTVITEVDTYHWNGGRGATPGNIWIRSASGSPTYGPYKATGSSGQGGAPNVNWTAHPNLTLPFGTYVVVDSDPATWSQNAQSHGVGFAIVRGMAAVAAKTVTPAAPAAPTAPPLPTPCHGNSASFLELAKPVCSGTPGSLLTLYVSRTGIKAMPTAIVFKLGPIGQSLYAANTLPSAIASFQEPVTLTVGNGVMPGSLFTVPIPPGICVFGTNHVWNYDLFDAANGGDIDVVAVRC